MKVNWISQYCLEYHPANTINSRTTSVVVGISNSKWRPPRANSFKINVDAACHPLELRTGLGAVIRNSSGSIVGASATPLHYRLDPLSAEALAILHGLQLAASLGVGEVEIETDSQIMARAIQNRDRLVSPQGAIIAEIRLLMVEINCSAIQGISRSLNKVAHNIAGWALSKDLPVIWANNFPIWITKLGLSDI